MLRQIGAVAVAAPLEAETFDLDVAAIKAAIGPRTRMVVVNTPHNPTGRVYSQQRLQALAGNWPRIWVRQGPKLRPPPCGPFFDTCAIAANSNSISPLRCQQCPIGR